MSNVEPLRLDMFVMPSDWAVARNVFVADSTDDAWRLARGNSLGSLGNPCRVAPRQTRRNP
jgi:alkanesulfonate monooxygenase SsuD/methylene tetrahydromethanopterin reductase-like flavin-dependent oxidoreductase (luciferase family)